MADLDWNASVAILDELSEGAFSFTHLEDSIRRYYGRDVVEKSLAWLARQDLIEVYQGKHAESLHVADKDAGVKLIDCFFDIAARERGSAIFNWLKLTAKGRDLLGLLGIGAPHGSASS